MEAREFPPGLSRFSTLRPRPAELTVAACAKAATVTRSVSRRHWAQAIRRRSSVAQPYRAELWRSSDGRHALVFTDD
jgi:hypothetical protein